jgi:1-acyl-sn-glycerol-3-phosphate acyltransferase
MIRALFTAAFFFSMTPLLISIQWLLDRLHLPGWGFIACNYYRVLVKIVGIRVHVAGEMVRDRAVLLVSNHVSWADILVIGSIAPLAFISKSEIANWPLVGITARLQRTVFVDRSRRQQTGDAIAEIVKRLAGGTTMVLFAEGTSSDGNRVLPFRSALIGAVKEAGSRSESGIVIQPMSICYTGINGMPMGRRCRPLIAWYGDLDFLPHIKTLMTTGAVDAVVTFGEPLTADGTTDRKAMAKTLEGTVRELTSATLRGRPRPAQAQAHAGLPAS